MERNQNNNWIEQSEYNNGLNEQGQWETEQNQYGGQQGQWNNQQGQWNNQQGQWNNQQNQQKNWTISNAISTFLSGISNVNSLPGKLGFIERAFNTKGYGELFSYNPKYVDSREITNNLKNSYSFYAFMSIILSLVFQLVNIVLNFSIFLIFSLIYSFIMLGVGVIVNIVIIYFIGKYNTRWRSDILKIVTIVIMAWVFMQLVMTLTSVVGVFTGSMLAYVFYTKGMITSLVSLVIDAIELYGATMCLAAINSVDYGQLEYEASQAERSQMFNQNFQSNFDLNKHTDYDGNNEDTDQWE